MPFNTLRRSTVRNLSTYSRHMRFSNMNRKQTYYDVLRVHCESTAKEIRRAFIKLSKQYHPDTNKTDGNTEEFVKICEAYKVLYKTSSRYKYDRQLRIRTELMSPVDMTFMGQDTHRDWLKYRASMQLKQLSQTVKPKPFTANKIPLIMVTCNNALVVSSDRTPWYPQPVMSEDLTTGSWIYKAYLMGFSLISSLIGFESLFQ